MRHPKMQNDEIEELANNMLNSTLIQLFRIKGLKLIKNETSKSEIGMDFVYQVVVRDTNEDKFLIVNQNKGINQDLTIIQNPTNPNYNKISYSVKNLTRPYSWYFNIKEPLLFTVCDINSKKIYWYFIQNDPLIPERIEQQRINEINSLQLYIPIDNVLNEENFDRFLSELEAAYVNQVRKAFGPIIETKSSNYDSLKNQLNDLHIIDQLFQLINLFENIKSIPESIIAKLFPFTVKNKTTLDNLTLNTDNEALFNLIKSVTYDEDEYQLTQEFHEVENYTDKIRKIIHFFQINYIYHLNYDGAQICVHDLFYSKQCECERCTLRRLDFHKVNQMLKMESSNYTIYDSMRKGYAAYLYGDFEKSVEIFYKVYTDLCFDKKESPISYYISKYNLLQLKKVNSSIFLNSEKNSAILEGIERNLEIIEIEKDASHFIDIFKSLKDNSFFHNTHAQIDSLVGKIRTIWYNDKHGGWTSSSIHNDLEIKYIRLNSFLENNLIIFNYYSEFKSLTTKVLEGLFALHTLQNEIIPKYERFSFPIIEMWILHVKYSDAKFLARRYNLEIIHYSEEQDFKNAIFELVENLSNSKSELVKARYFNLAFDIDSVVNNILLIVSKLDLTSSEVDELILKIIEISDHNNRDLSFIGFGGLVDVLIKYKNINKGLIKRIIQLKTNSHSFNSNEITYLFNYYNKDASPVELTNLFFEILEVTKSDCLGLLVKMEKYEGLWSVCSILEQKLRDSLKDIVNDNLRQEFNPNTFYFASVNDLLDFDKILFEKFKDTIPNISNTEAIPFLAYRGNIRFDQVLNIAFKFKLDMAQFQKYIHYCKKNDQLYYSWLTNLETFNYENFNPYWLTDSFTPYHINAFKSSKEFAAGVRQKLKTNHLDGAVKFYFKLFGD